MVLGGKPRRDSGARKPLVGTPGNGKAIIGRQVLTQPPHRRRERFMLPWPGQKSVAVFNNALGAAAARGDNRQPAH